MKDKILKLLNDEGFKNHVRHCDQPSGYGHINDDGVFVDDGCIEIEDWSNEDLANLLANELKEE